MARLLRKRTTDKRKKRSVDSDQDSLQGPEQEAGDVSPRSDVILKNATQEIKKNIISQRRLPSEGGPKSFLQKWEWVDRSVQFLRDVKIELKKVTWPSRKQAMGSTLVVIILVLIISVFLGIVDIGLSSLVRIVLQ